LSFLHGLNRRPSDVQVRRLNLRHFLSRSRDQYGPDLAGIHDARENLKLPERRTADVTAVPLPAATKPEALLALGVSEDEGLLFAATANAVTAQRLDGSIAWAAATGWQRIVGLAVSGPHLLVADRAAARGVGSWCDMTVVECVREPRMVRRNAVTEDYRRDKKR
jgi:hypothetical protein